jgi:hypothetical protein
MGAYRYMHVQGLYSELCTQIESSWDISKYWFLKRLAPERTVGSLRLFGLVYVPGTQTETC